jgi:hypothetical protein
MKKPNMVQMMIWYHVKPKPFGLFIWGTFFGENSRLCLYPQIKTIPLDFFFFFKPSHYNSMKQRGIRIQAILQVIQILKYKRYIYVDVPNF